MVDSKARCYIRIKACFKSISCPDCSCCTSVVKEAEVSLGARAVVRGGDRSMDQYAEAAAMSDGYGLGSGNGVLVNTIAPDFIETHAKNRIAAEKEVGSCLVDCFSCIGHGCGSFTSFVQSCLNSCISNCGECISNCDCDGDDCGDCDSD